MEKNETYWSSGLMAVNPDHIIEFAGMINKTIFREDNVHYPVLFLTIKRNIDSLEHSLGICYNPIFTDGFDDEKQPSKEELLKPIKELYQNFRVSNYSDLVGKLVTALYYQFPVYPNLMENKIANHFPTDYLIGIRKK